ncbi:MAG: HVO_0476 family zinc finger protein [Methanomassiliicoccales archaeon]
MEKMMREKGDMSIPNSLYLDCPSCGEKRLHEVLRGRLSRGGDVMETTVRCQECNHVHVTVVREPSSVKLPLLLSDMGETRKLDSEFAEDELVSVGDELFVGEYNVVITAIEKEEGRAAQALAKEIKAIWAKRYDRVRVKVSVNKTSRTLAAELTALPEEEFYVGDLLAIGRDNVVIHGIKTKEGMVRQGGVAARDIVRIYAKSARTTYS